MAKASIPRKQKHTRRQPHISQTIGQARAWLESQGGSNSTLLIPPALWSYVRRRQREFGSLNRYLHYLVCTYGLSLDLLGAEPAEHKRCKKKYQRVKKNYRRIDFRPDGVLWEQLRDLSIAYGPSMCWMFVYLVIVEICRWRAAGRPTNFYEAPPIPPHSGHKKRNSEAKRRKVLQKLRAALQKPGPRTVSVRIVSAKERTLARSGSFRS